MNCFVIYITINNLFIVDDSKSDDAEEEKGDDTLDDWSNVIATPVESWNIVWRYKQSKSLHWGKLPLIEDKRPKSISLGGWPTWTYLTDKQLEEINKFPIKITESQGKKTWTKYLYDLNSDNYWFYDRTEQKMYKSRSKVRLRGGFQTRAQARLAGVVVTDEKGFNDAGRSISYGIWPRPYLPGHHGYCLLLSVYYVTNLFSLTALEDFKELYHTEEKLAQDKSVFLTDGTYDIVRKINQELFNYDFVEINLTSQTGNEIFGNSSNVGKFLIEYTDNISTSVGYISHFVSLDTEVMLLFEPMCAGGPIVVDRNCNDYCCFHETLKLHHNIEKNLSVLKIWKLQCSNKRKSLEDTGSAKPKKKRRGKNQIKMNFFRHVN